MPLGSSPQLDALGSISESGTLPRSVALCGKWRSAVASGAYYFLYLAPIMASGGTDEVALALTHYSREEETSDELAPDR